MQVEEAMDRRSVQLEPTDYEAYRQSWPSSRGPDTARYSEPGYLSAGENETAGLGCNLERTGTGHHYVTGVKPGGACAEHGIAVGSSLLSVDGVPLCGMNMDEVKRLTMGMIGTHVCVRYRPPGVHAEYPAIEKVLTRLPASYVRAAGYETRRERLSPLPGSHPPQDDAYSRENMHPTATFESRPNGIETFRDSLSNWLTGIGILKGSGSNSGQERVHTPKIPVTREPEHSARASERKAFLTEAEEGGAYRALRPELIRSIADEYMEKTRVRGSRGSSRQELAPRLQRPTTIPPSYDVAKRPESVSGKQLERVVHDILDRRSRRFAHLLHGDVRPPLTSVAEKYENARVSDKDLDALTQETRHMTASSVLFSDGLQSGRDYLYAHEDEAVDVDARAADALNPVVLERERKSLWKSLLVLEQSLADLNDKVLGRDCLILQRPSRSEQTLLRGNKVHTN